MSALKAFLSFVNQHQLFTSSDRILLAVSGGKDSVLMTHLFAEAGFSFGIAHCNFQLRAEESDRDEAFVKQLANNLQVPFYVQKFDTESYAENNKVSIQMAARALRYEWFEYLAVTHNYQYIALAQHQNDALETILWNLCRGTGVAGMHGILPKRGNLIRPLLFLKSEDIQKLIEQQAIAYVEDSSNLKTDYSRNLIRQEVVPVLRRLNPNLEETFQENMKRFSELEQLLDLRIAELQTDFFSRKEDGVVCFTKQKALALEPAALLLYHLLKPFGFVGAQIQDLLRILQTGQSGKSIVSTDFYLSLDRDVVFILPVKNLKDEGLNEKEVVVGSNSFGTGVLEVALSNHVGNFLTAKTNQVYVDADKLSFPLFIRYYKQGDSFKPLGMNGSKKLSDFFVSLKIPIHEKLKIPLLCDAQGRIVWVIPYRIDNRYKITESTKKVVIFEWNFNHGK